MTEAASSRVVIVGAGQAALSCAAKLRQMGFTGSITLCGDEPELPYQRPPLSKKYLTGEMSRERLLLRPAEWFEKNAIEVHTGVKAEAIDRFRKQVSLSDSQMLDYDWLVLATGSRPRNLPVAVTKGLQGIHTVRSLADVDRLGSDMRQSKSVVILGGGYIGLEAASVLVKQGLAVTVVEAAPRILARVASAETARLIGELHASHGVDIRAGVALQEITGTNDRISSVILSDGTTLNCDMLVIGIGIVVNSELASASGLVVENGIVVDEHCVTSDASILAIGDCANFPHGEGRLRLESVPHAIAHGEHAASTIMASPTTYMAKPWFWSDQFDTKLQIAGLNTGYDQTVQRGPAANGEASVWYYRNQRLLAVDALNSPAAYVVAKRLIESGQSIAPDRVADSAENPKSWLAV
jgi:3-phenylpropionate/trans-cinnamate dioxygenase ferredoxin reductase component